MPLSRRNTGRSPVPPTPPSPAWRPSTFLPPSHYAAAAASADPYLSDSSFEFKPGPTTPTNSNRRQSTNQLADIPLIEAQLLPSLRDTIHRMTRPPSAHLLHSPSAAHLDIPTKPLARSISPSFSSASSATPSFNSTSSAASTSSALSPHSQYEQQLPLPPHTSKSPRPQFTDTHDPVLSSLNRESTYSHHPQPSAATPSRLSHLLSRPPFKDHTPSSPPSTTTPTQKQGPSRSVPSTPTASRPLKSALRPPALKISRSRSSTPTPVPPSPSPNPTERLSTAVKRIASLRTVNSATPSSTAFQGKGTTSQSQPASHATRDVNSSSNSKVPKPLRFRTRTRARTDPDIGLTLPPSPTPSTSTTKSSRTPTTTSTGSFVSHLPRRVQFSSHVDRDTTRNDQHTVDSEVEIESQQRGLGFGGGRLVVTNATVVPSSSSSGMEEIVDNGPLVSNDSHRWQRSEAILENTSSTESQDSLDEGDEWGRMSASRKPLGLGLGYRRSRRRVLDDGKNTLRRAHANDDSVDEVEPWVLSPYPNMSSTPPRPSSKASVTADDARRSSQTSEHRRRKEALLGILNGLDVEQGANGDEEENEDREGSSESDYCGEEGLAVSRSLSMSDGGGRDVDGRGLSKGVDREGRWQQRTSSAPGRRSASYGPACVSPARLDHRRNSSGERRWEPEMRRSRGEYEGMTSPSREPITRATSGRDPTGSGNWMPRERFSSAQERKSIVEDVRFSQRPRPAAEHPDSIRFSLVEDSYAVASRERKALGILPSVSDYFTGGSESVHDEGEEGGLRHVDSDLSSVGNGLLREEEDHEEDVSLSVGAENLFRQLSGKGVDGDQRKRNATIRPRSDMLQSSGAESVNGPQNSRSTEALQSLSGTWRSNFTPSVYASLSKAHGDREMQRQQVIWELHSSEAEFVNRLHTTVDLFILPLRAQNSKTWILGVPPEVARLFDWLEDIVNLHTEILSILHSARDSQYPVIVNIAETLKCIVPRLEVYQPYLVRLEHVAGMVGRSLQDQDGNDFGEFVKIQEKAAIRECGDGWGLERLLVEPVNRLAAYPDILRKIHMLTPKFHQDYLATFSLLHATDVIIRVMTEVKHREDEYDVVKDISTRIQGLPCTVQLARRERRLLARGLLHLAEGSVATAPKHGSENRFPDCEHPRPNISLPSPSIDHPSPTNRLFEAVNEWGGRRGRSGSVKSTASSALSFRSYESQSTTESALPITPSSGNCPETQYNVQFPLHPSFPESCSVPHSPSAIPAGYGQQEGTGYSDVYLFVFTDLVLLTSPISTSLKGQAHEPRTWRLLDKIGVARILGVEEHSRGSRPHILLDLLPIDSHNLDSGVIQDATPVTTLQMLLPGMTSRINPEVRLDDERSTLMSALQQCFQFTLRSLSFPSNFGEAGAIVRKPNMDAESVTHQSVISILNAGLPLPKSPSFQMEDAFHGQATDNRQQEREERGWWALRFRQVVGEMQRQEVPLICHIGSRIRSRS